MEPMRVDLDTPNGGALRREVLIPVPMYRRASSLIGLSVVLVLLASAVDAVVWTYQTQRRLWRESPSDTLRPSVDAAERAAPGRRDHSLCSRRLLVE